MSEQPTDTATPQPPLPTGSTAYTYDVTDDDGTIIATFQYAPEKVSDVEAVRLVRGAPLADSVVVRAAGHVLFSGNVDRQAPDLHLDRYEQDDDGNAVGEAISHPIRLV